MKNFVQDGKTITVTGPTGGVVSGDLFHVGDQPVVAFEDIADGAQGEAKAEGVFTLNKTTGEGTIAQGTTLYWNSITKKTTTQTSGGSPVVTFKVVGRAWNTAGTSATTIDVKLDEA